RAGRTSAQELWQVFSLGSWGKTGRGGLSSSASDFFRFLIVGRSFWPPTGTLAAKIASLNFQAFYRAKNCTLACSAVIDRRYRNLTLRLLRWTPQDRTS